MNKPRWRREFFMLKERERARAEHEGLDFVDVRFPLLRKFTRVWTPRGLFRRIYGTAVVTLVDVPLLSEKVRFWQPALMQDAQYFDGAPDDS